MFRVTQFLLREKVVLCRIAHLIFAFLYFITLLFSLLRDRWLFIPGLSVSLDALNGRSRDISCSWVGYVVHLNLYPLWITQHPLFKMTQGHFYINSHPVILVFIQYSVFMIPKRCTFFLINKLGALLIGPTPTHPV